MLSGEYAVLLGGTAMVVPIDRYLIMSRTDEKIENHKSAVIQNTLDYEVPGIKPSIKFENLIIDSSQFFAKDKNGRKVKLGLGLSSAEAVGVMALRYQAEGREFGKFKEEIADYAFRAHKAVQGNLGSGADVYCCAIGDPISFINDNDDISYQVFDHGMDNSLPLNLVWSGSPSNTRTLLEKFFDWISSSNGNAEGDIGKLVSISNELSAVWRGNNSKDLFEALDEHDRLLESLLKPAGIEYKLEIHKYLEEWARKRGGRAKPTGAGGGDMILMVGDLPLDELDMLTLPLKPAEHITSIN